PIFFSEGNAVSYDYDGNFVYNITHGNVRPYVTVGIGGVSTDAEQNSKTNFAFNYGGGAKFLFKNIGVRFEVNDHLTPNHWLTGKTEHDLQIQYGFLFGL
ncbi:MAG: hypothetical protein C5B54_04070, partial [Acidobacteria bacterium]